MWRRLFILLVLLGLPGFARAQTAAPATADGAETIGAVGGPVEHPLRGLYWDTSFALGLGSGVRTGGERSRLGGATPIMAGLRLGGLWAADPAVLAFGLGVHLGGLHRVGIGAELEISHLGGLFAGLGVAYARGDALVNTATLGYRMVGLQYQHRAFDGEAYHALFVLLRMPFGLWLAVQKQGQVAFQAQAQAAAHSAPPAEPARPDPVLLEQARSMRERAMQAEEDGRLVEAEAALRRAQQLAPTIDGLMQLVRVQQARGRLVEALGQLQRFVPSEADDAKSLQAARAALRASIPVLRVSGMLDTDSGLQVRVDDQPCPLALAAYDCLLNPGQHTVVLTRAGRPLIERVVEVEPRQIVRLQVPAPEAAR